jgi:uncharacterized protein with von Willebrand factor type A (vWA) domain
MDKEDFQDYITKHAGIGHKEIDLSNIVDIIDKIAKNLSNRELDIFYLARMKEITERYRREEALNSVPFPEDEMTIKNIENPHEVLKLLPAQFALDDDVFTQKLVKKELLVRDYQSRKLKKQALYLLIDVSGSMDGNTNTYACGVALALVRQAIEEGSVYFLRFFDDRPHELHTITTEKDAKEMCDILLHQPFSGGGTSIQNALYTAINDIVTYKDKFEKAEIMVISDGEDQVRMKKEDLKDVKIHSTIINGENPDLKELSESYRELKSSDL